MVRRSALLLLGVLLLGVRSDAAAPVSVRIYPRFAFAGHGLRVTVRVEKHEDNRRLSLVWEGPESGSTDRPHVGTGAPLQIVFEKEFQRMKPGVTFLQAFVQRKAPEGSREPWVQLASTVEQVEILEGIPQQP